jgi:DNA-binding PadR family transcriptional regulator
MKRNHYNQETCIDHQPGRLHHDDSPRGEHGGHEHAGHKRNGRGQGRRAGHGFGGPESFGPGAGGAFGPPFGPRGSRGGFGPRGSRRAGKGDIRSVILSLLAEGPSNGYGLIKAIAEKTGGAWRPSPGSVYPTLQQLVDEELIVSRGDGRSTEYDLSETGRSYVEEHAEDFKKAWDATAGQSESVATFFESASKLMGVMHQFRSAATDEQRAAAASKLDETRRALYLILAD